MYTSQRAHLVSADLHRYPMIDDRAACARTYIPTSASSSGRKRTTISAGVSRLLSGNECPRYQQAEHDNREALRRFLHGWTLHRFCQLSRPQPELANRGR
jgi:hypothetical protein